MRTLLLVLTILFTNTALALFTHSKKAEDKPVQCQVTLPQVNCAEVLEEDLKRVLINYNDHVNRFQREEVHFDTCNLNHHRDISIKNQCVFPRFETLKEKYSHDILKKTVINYGTTFLTLAFILGLLIFAVMNAEISSGKFRRRNRED